MKITEFESGQAGTAGKAEEQNKILPKTFLETVHQKQTRSRAKTSREEALEVAQAALESVPDVREDVVNEIKARIERGEYKVDPEEVGEMMIRRMRADKIR